MEDEEIGVPRDKDVGTAIDGDLEEVVIALIAAGVDVLADFDEFGRGVEKIEKLLGLGLGEVLAELEAGSDVTELGELLIGGKELKIAPSEELLEDRELAAYEEADPEVGINDDPQHAVPV